jgi:hypothetical protein
VELTQAAASASAAAAAPLLLLLLLLLFAQTSKQYVEVMEPEAVVYAGYALARNGHLPSNSWRKAYLRALQVTTATFQELAVTFCKYN